ncbi:MAG: class I SAM-dependent methyltransferase [Lachnospiraceae bacterium]|uniref:class I SAM-dependent methyltransferase n=1 Tax=Candidatus Merdisoma sp. JLR.KK011 TaxID=3114299 RepID=UPI002FF3BF6F|nr:class I SAM-dependent methyltransferase [Lachnospiraceae bacterium]
MKKEMYKSMYETETYHWYFKSKYEIVLGILEKYGLKKKSDYQIVDIGCGCGVMLEVLSKYGAVTGIDFSEEALEYCRMNFSGRLEQADLQRYVSNKMYDYGIALDVLEHVEDDRKALINIKNMLNKGAVCVITVPALNMLWSAHDKNCMHKRRYTKPQLENLIKASGLKVEYCSYYNFWFFPIVFLVRKIENLLKLDNSGSRLEYGFSDSFLNYLLYRIFVSEKYRICAHKNFFIGVSLICVIRR